MAHSARCAAGKKRGGHKVSNAGIHDWGTRRTVRTQMAQCTLRSGRVGICLVTWDFSGPLGHSSSGGGAHFRFRSVGFVGLINVGFKHSYSNMRSHGQASAVSRSVRAQQRRDEEQHGEARQGKTTADTDRTHTGRGPHDRLRRNGRGPDTGNVVSPTGVTGHWRRHGAGMARAWRGLYAFFGLGGAGMARAWRGLVL
eukprot:gene9824-biopygen10771